MVKLDILAVIVKNDKCILSRLAAIDGVGGDTGVKSQHRLRHLPTAAPSLTVVLIFIFLYSNANHLVQFRAETIPRVTRVIRIQKIFEANYVPRRIV